MARLDGLDMDDFARLDALASHRPPIPFEEAFAMLDHGTPRDVAEERYAQLAQFYSTPDASPAPPKIEGESDHVHLVHSACQSDGEWLTTWCGIAVERSGQRTDDDVADERLRDLCNACVEAVRAAGGRCRLCGQMAT